ncbi:MAG TPA: VOC family protein [Flavisolibacter sp.]|nr:VOC family protein [Flavisolibacter sp.]
MSKLNFVSPFFIVSNLNDSVSFYVNKLGFEVWYTGPDDGPYWAMVGRDSVSIMLKAIADDIKAIPNHTRHEWAAWDAYISTEEPDTLFKEFNSTGITFRQPIRDNGDGLRGFEVMDADGYVLFFGRPKA